jgi:pimeloyl-ACP methyl ester carboxylesterase
MAMHAASEVNMSHTQMGMANIEGADLYYETAGEGSALVLVHAGFVDHRMWDAQFSVFAERFRTIRYDLRGFGKSKFTQGPFSHRRDLYQLLEFLKVERAHLIGCSVGGATVIDFTLEHPAMTDSLVLISSALSGYQPKGEMPKPMKDLSAALESKDVARAAEIALRIWIDGPQRTPDQVDPRIRDSVREMSLTALPNAFMKEEPLEPSASKRLGEITVPTLVVVGELDDDSVKAISDLLEVGILGSQKVAIPKAAHLPSLEQPEKFNQAVLEFYAKAKRRN